jgi:hypothetical protein
VAAAVSRCRAVDWTENFVGGVAAGDTASRVCDRLQGADAFTTVSYKTLAWFCRGWELALGGAAGPAFLHPADAWTGAVPDVSVAPHLLYMVGDMDSAIPLPYAASLAAR